jgi:lysyl endopeptidase
MQSAKKQYCFLKCGLLFIATIFSLLSSVQAQIPHGNHRPGSEGAEKSHLNASVDYFVTLPAFDIDSALAVSCLPGNRIGGLQFAQTLFTDLSPENSGIVFSENDTLIWKVGIRSNGAYSINVFFGEYHLPDGAYLFVYNPNRTVILGPFTNANGNHAGNFSVAPIGGDELIVEYHEPPGASSNRKIRLTEVNHDYLGLFRAEPRFQSINMPCLPEASCNTTLDTIRRSTCLLIINGNSYCTGTLINNTAKDGKPYLLTASHCLSNQVRNGERIIAFLNYDSPRCKPTIRGSEDFSLSGSVCRALSNEIDFALIEFLEAPPSDYRPWYAGWSINTNAETDKPYICIQHPGGETKKYSTEEDALIQKSWPDLISGIYPNNHWYVDHWEKGHTWGGSSGAALLDQNFRIVGGLSGGDSGGSFGCGEYSEGDYFFRMDKAWNTFSDSARQLKCWLDPLAQSSQQFTTTALDGMDPYAVNPASRISNIQQADSVGIILTHNGWGSILGHGSAHTTNFAEHFEVQDSCLLLGAYLMVAKGSQNANKPVYVTVFAGGNKPGNLLKKEMLKLSYPNYSNSTFTQIEKTTYTNQENFIRFEEPIPVGQDFFIGYEISYPITSSSDSFYVYGAIRNNLQNTAFFRVNDQWKPYPEHPYNPIGTSLWIEPVVIKDTVRSGSNGSYDIDESRPIVLWTKSESTLSIYFPSDWIESTQLEIVDLTGRRLLSKTIQPPVAIVTINEHRSGILILRFNNGNKISTVKILI